MAIIFKLIISSSKCIEFFYTSQINKSSAQETKYMFINRNILNVDGSSIFIIRVDTGEKIAVLFLYLKIQRE